MVALIVVVIIIIANMMKGATPVSDPTTTDDPSISQSDDPSPSDSSSDPSSDDSGLIIPNVKPTLWLKGDCLKGYVDINTPADIVECSSAHSAQLVNTYEYSDSAAFPGKAALQTKGEATCDAVPLTSAADSAGVKEQYAYPTESTWANGDRLIQCIAYAKDKKDTLTDDVRK